MKEVFPDCARDIFALLLIKSECICEIDEHVYGRDDDKRADISWNWLRKTFVKL